MTSIKDKPGTSGKETDREAATGCQYETDRAAVLRHQEASQEAGLRQ